MRKIKILLSIACIIAIALGCASEKEKLEKKIVQLEDEIYSDTTYVYNKEKGEEMVIAYESFFSNYPEDSKSPDYMFKAADNLSNGMYSKKAIEYFKRLLVEYPSYEKNAETMFLLAFTYENVSGDMINAENFYKKFIQKYPNHDLHDDAIVSLNNLGKTPEQMIKEFEEKARLANGDSIASVQE